MTSEKQDAFSLGADVGGKDAYEATFQHFHALRLQLRRKCIGPYSEEIHEFALVLRIDGSVQSWGERGIKNLIFRVKQNYVTVDIFVPKEEWLESTRFRKFLSSFVSEAVEQIILKAQKKGINIVSEKIRADVNAAISDFMALA